MNFKRWKLGAVIAIGCGLLTALAGLEDGTTWKGFVRVLAVALLSNFGNFLVKHPVDDITDTTQITKP